MGDKLPRSVIVVHVDTVFFQCSKAIVRSKLWNPPARRAQSLPSTGTILADVEPARGSWQRTTTRPRRSG